MSEQGYKDVKIGSETKKPKAETSADKEDEREMSVEHRLKSMTRKDLSTSTRESKMKDFGNILGKIRRAAGGSSKEREEKAKKLAQIVTENVDD